LPGESNFGYTFLFTQQVLHHFWHPVFLCLEIDNPFITASETSVHTAVCVWLAGDGGSETSSVLPVGMRPVKTQTFPNTVLKSSRFEAWSNCLPGKPLFSLKTIQPCRVPAAHVLKASGITGAFPHCLENFFALKLPHYSGTEVESPCCCKMLTSKGWAPRLVPAASGKHQL